MGLFQGMLGVGVPRDPSEASHLGLLAILGCHCLPGPVNPFTSGSYSGRRPQQETRGRQSSHLLASWPCYRPLKKQSPEAWVGAGLCRSQETSGHC